MTTQQKKDALLEEIHSSKIVTRVQDVIQNNRLVKKRIAALSQLHFVEVAVGSGGVGRVLIRKSGAVIVQITAGWGRYNYATCCIVGIIENWKFIPNNI